MPEFTLKLSIDPESLKIIKAAQQRIILAKPVDGASPNVAWVAFDPFQSNTVTWNEEFNIYASTTEIQNGAEILKMSDTTYPAQDAAYYSFDPSATFSGPFTGTGAPPRGSYRVINNMPSSEYRSLTMGLQQKARVNGRDTVATPVNAATVPATNKATFTPLTTVFAWLQASLVSATMITDVSGDSSKVVFGNGVFSASLVYDPAAGRFVPDGQQALGVGIERYDRAEALFASPARARA